MEKIMSLRLIGASFGRTASLSLKKALEILTDNESIEQSVQTILEFIIQKLN